MNTQVKRRHGTEITKETLAQTGVYTYFVRFNLYKGGIQEKMVLLTIVR